MLRGHVSTFTTSTSILVIALALSLTTLDGVHAADFLRGDANADGAVTISDAQAILEYSQRDVEVSSCLAALNADGVSGINITDAVYVMNFLFLGGAALPAPFPEVGPLPQDSAFDCEDYASVPPLEDPQATIVLLSASTPGGDVGDVTLVFGITSSQAVPAYSFRFRLPEVVTDVRRDSPGSAQGEDLTGSINENGHFNAALLDDGDVLVGMLFSLSRDQHAIPPSTSPVPAYALDVCLAEGTPAGEYPITILEGELADPISGRAVPAEVTGGVLVVQNDVTVATVCTRGGPGPIGPPEAAENVVFELVDTVAAPGTAVSVPFVIGADGGGIQGYVYSIDFDEEVLTATAIEPSWTIPGGFDFDFYVAEFNNDNETPGNGGVDEGFLSGAVLFSFLDPVSMPVGEPVEALRFHFDVFPDAPEEVTRIRFADGAHPEPHEPFSNAVATGGVMLRPENLDSFVALDCELLVGPIVDITVFVRGDTSGDGEVDLTDAQRTLNYLFLSGPAPHCFDAADANDDATINISDPIYTLSFLFLGHAPIPPPYPAAGTDPTSDGITCTERG